MNKLIYLLFLSIFFLGYLSGSSDQLHILPRSVSWLPELLSILIILIISIRITLGYGKDIPPICIFFLILFFLNITIGAIINQVPAGPLIAGSRSYLKLIPFFILPFVYRFSSQQITGQLKLLLFLCLIQVPVTLYQRLVLSRGIASGDAVSGTLTGSGLLTILLTCAIAILMAFYLAKRIEFRSFIFIFFLLFLPMAMNETKVSVILLPLAIVLPILLSSHGINLKQLIPLIFLGSVAGIGFIFIYDHFQASSRSGILDFVMEGEGQGYEFSGAEIGTHHGNVGRADALVLAFKILSKNILNLLFGLGIGNVKDSFLPSLSGVYAEKFSSFNVSKSSLSLILWELGILGALLHYALFFMVFIISRRLSKHDSLVGALSHGWSVVAIIIMIATPYASIFNENVTGYLFWYFSGYIISENVKYM